MASNLLAMALFPPPTCQVCATFTQMLGMEMTRAIRLLHRALPPDCACGLTTGAHGTAHPHAAALLGCAEFVAPSVDEEGACGA